MNQVRVSQRTGVHARAAVWRKHSFVRSPPITRRLAAASLDGGRNLVRSYLEGVQTKAEDKYNLEVEWWLLIVVAKGNNNL